MICRTVHLKKQPVQLHELYRQQVQEHGKKTPNWEILAPPKKKVQYKNVCQTVMFV